MNRDCVAGPKRLALGLLVGLALSIGGCPKQSALRESSSGSALVLFRGVQLSAVSALSVDTLLLWGIREYEQYAWNIPSPTLAVSAFPSSAPCQDEQWTWCISLVPYIYCLYPSLALSFSSCWKFLLLQIILSIFGGGKERRFDLGLLSAMVWDDLCFTPGDGSYCHLSLLNVRLPHLCYFKTLKMTKKGGFFPPSVGRIILIFQN